MPSAAPRSPARPGRGAASAATPRSTPSGRYTVTGVVVREQQILINRAGGTRLLQICGFLAPLAAALALGQAEASELGGAMFTGVMLVLLPVAIIVMLMSLGGGGWMGFMGRTMSNSFRVSHTIATTAAARRGHAGASGSALILRTSDGDVRVIVASGLDMPIGQTVTATGPFWGGQLHAWWTRAHGLDTRSNACRGVAGALAALTLGAVITTMVIIAAIGSALS